jgi:hypothetical protein
MVVPKESQLFQPIGGVGTKVSAVAEAEGLGLVVSPFTLEPRGVAEAKEASTSRAISETWSSIRGFMRFSFATQSQEYVREFRGGDSTVQDL